VQKVHIWRNMGVLYWHSKTINLTKIRKIGVFRHTLIQKLSHYNVKNLMIFNQLVLPYEQQKTPALVIDK